MSAVLSRLCCIAHKPEVDEFDRLDELKRAQQNVLGERASDIQLTCAHLLSKLHCLSNAEESWLARIGKILSACKVALQAVDVRVAIFGSESHAAWVLTEFGGSVRTDGWGMFFNNLSEQPDAVAIIRGRPQQEAEVGLMWLGPAAGPLTAKPPWAAPPDPNALVCHPVNKPLRLGPSDLIVLPVRHGTRLTAALVLGLCKDTAMTAAAAGTGMAAGRGRDAVPAGGGCGSGLCAASTAANLLLSPADLADLKQLAHVLAFGILGVDPGHARFLTVAADHLGQLPLRQSLSDILNGVLQAVSELLALRFSVHLRPILALTHSQFVGRAVLITQRGSTVTGTGSSSSPAATAAAASIATPSPPPPCRLDSLLETQASIRSLSTLAMSSAGHRSVLPYRTGSELGAQAEHTNSVTEASFVRVKAVRISLANTLLCEVLRLRPSSSLQAEDVGTAHVNGTVHGKGVPRFVSMIVRDASGFVLEEQKPCRDILTIGNLLGCSGVGSLALCLEAVKRSVDTAAAAVAWYGGGGATPASGADRITPAAASPVSKRESQPAWQQRDAGGSSCGLAMATARPPGLLADAPRSVCVDVPAGSMYGDGTAATTAVALATTATSPLVATDAQLHASPVFALYLVSIDTLPQSVLHAVVEEGKLLLGLLLDAFWSAVAASGRAAAELRALELQLLDQCGALSTTHAHVQDRTADNDGQGKQVKRVISGAKSCKRLDGHPGEPSSAAPMRLLRVGSSANVAATRGLLSTATDRRITAVGPSVLVSGSRFGLELLDRELQQQEGALRPWMLASSPELALEVAPGPSQLEVMVSTMRSHLGAAVAGAETASEARNAMAQDLAALDLHEVIGKGGQGVVYKGVLHGLETAIKLNVCHDGEPLAEDDLLDVAVDRVSGPGDADTDGPRSTAKWEEQRARLRKAKRSAMEHAVTPTLSHPNIVQVYATFSNVVAVKCTYRGDRRSRIRLYSRDDATIAAIANQGKTRPLNQVICLEYCDCGTLLDAAHSAAFRPSKTTSFSAIARPSLEPLYMSLLEVALALRYLHSRRLVHCDLKPANVLLKGSSRDVRGWTCKLSDFGCTRLMTEIPQPPEGACMSKGQTRRDHALPPSTVLGFLMAAPLGTISYMAPELFRKGQILTAAVDIYAFGIMMYEILTCHAPYSDVPPPEVPRHVVRWHMRPEFHPLAPPEYCALASRCWSACPTQRPTASDLVSEIEKLLKSVRKSAEKQQGQASYTVRQCDSQLVARAPRDAAAVTVAAAVPGDTKTTAATEAAEAEAAPPPPVLFLPPSAPYHENPAEAAVEAAAGAEAPPRPADGLLMADLL